MAEKILTPEQVAERLAVTPKAVREWLKSGMLPGRKIGRLWRIRERDYDAFVAPNNQGGGLALDEED